MCEEEVQLASPMPGMMRPKTGEYRLTLYQTVAFSLSHPLHSGKEWEEP